MMNVRSASLAEQPQFVRVVKTMSKYRRALAGTLALALVASGSAGAAAGQYRQVISNDPGECAAGAGPAVRVTVQGIKASTGSVRVQLYRATEAEWLKKGAWLKRIETRARAGAMSFCLPVPATGSYAVAVRHDLNGNGESDFTKDGGGMSNNPSINIFNLGKPSVRKTAFTVGDGITAIRIDMKYMS